MRLHLPHQQLRGVHRQPVIHIRKLHKRSARLGKGPVARGGYAPVFLVDRLYSVIRGGKCLHDLPGAIPAAVVYQNQFQLGVVLIQNAVRAALYAFLSVIYGNDDADLFHFLFLLEQHVFFEREQHGYLHQSGGRSGNGSA